MANRYEGKIERIDDCRLRVPKDESAGMRVDGIIYADEALYNLISHDAALTQVMNVATLPGIVGHSLAMPDIHYGYGFCIGGVAATDPEEDGVISPGGVGYDINCGVRALRTTIAAKDIKDRMEDLVNELFKKVPCGVGQSGEVRLKGKEMDEVLTEGAAAVVKRGYGVAEDCATTEAGGKLKGANPRFISDRVRERGRDQCGTLGSGNHFLEIQEVEEVYDEKVASVFGLEKGQAAVMIHSGSRGLGYQVCDEAIRDLRDCPKRYGIELPDRQLVCAPIRSDEGQKYLKAMRCAANYAWANRQILAHLARKAFEAVFETSWEKLGMHQVYDVAHNIAKMETFNGRELCVHRKGATRAYPAGHPEVPEKYRQVGQPVLIPGDMGRCSYILVGQPGAMEDTFGSTCHGAGRVLSRAAAIRSSKGRSIHKELMERGVYARARSNKGLAEEQPEAYKDVQEVVSVVEKAGISKAVCKLRPLGVIKG